MEGGNKIMDSKKEKILPKRKPISFKEKWEEVDEYCPHCNSITKRSTGLTKQNLKRLVMGKPSFIDWIIFFIIIMTLFMAWAYNHDMEACQEVVNNIDSICTQYMGDMLNRDSKNVELTQRFNATYVAEQLGMDETDEIQER